MNDLPSTQRTDFYPAVAPFETGMLPLDETHTMYFEQSGNPNGVPVLFLHGGPGSGASPTHRQFFDPEFYRIVIFDQRGAGRSTPHGELRNNSTAHLVGDIETLRQHLSIDRWAVFGGSWGSTLALAYAEAYPVRVSALVLRGVFLGRDTEVEWFLTGARNFFPDVWERFIAPLSGVDIPSRRDWRTILRRYHALLTDPDSAVHTPAARVWSAYEGSCSTLLPNPGVVANFASDRVALGLARIEAHYFINNTFLKPNQLLDDVGRIRHIPTVIIQGRYDVVCPPVSAFDLAAAFPEAELLIVPDAGHSAFEAGIRARLIGAMENLKQRWR